MEISLGFGKRMDKTLPGLDGFYMVGQWVEPGGGLPPAAQSGRNVIQVICKKDKKSFVTSTP
jgi:phytoene dehydrogenase-like protein